MPGNKIVQVWESDEVEQVCSMLDDIQFVSWFRHSCGHVVIVLLAGVLQDPCEKKLRVIALVRPSYPEEQAAIETNKNRLPTIH
jgi:hypothetical protein